MTSKPASPGLSWLAILFVALALSIGWGVRGNWGHEYGAMIPGGLAAMAAVLVSGREDWRRRIALFAFFGAVGWSFGGSISYMQVIGYTHSGHALTVWYGFACLFLIGFLWAAAGGAGTALPAFLDRDRLTELLLPTGAVFVAWGLQDAFFSVYFRGLSLLGTELHKGLRDQLREGLISADQFREQTSWIAWNDSDWIAVVVAAAAVVLLAIVRRRVCWGTSLVLYLCAGWWIAFTLLTDRQRLDLHMTPPRGDNWAGSLGMIVAMFVFLYRHREWGITWTALVTGLFGGLGFSGATLIKLVLVHPEFQNRVFGRPIDSNWHSILEQAFGFISGIGVALAMGYWCTRAPRQIEQPPVRRWAEPLAVLFVLLLVTYVNIVKNVDVVWLRNGTLQPTMWDVSSRVWFNWAYFALALAVAVPVVAWYRGREIALLPVTNLGRGQLLFIVFLWWIVIGNLTRTVPFAEQRMITEGVIHVNACLCTLFALLLPRRDPWSLADAAVVPFVDGVALLRKTLAVGLAATVLVIVSEATIVRAMWGDTFAGHAGKHIRFGPDATLDKK
jgi:hypothetical protein